MDADTAEAIETALDRIHASVMAGDLAALPAQVEMLEERMQESAGAPPSAQLDRLRTKAARNALCLEAAGRGLRAAQRRLAEIRAATIGLQTYDGQGQRRVLTGAAHDLARRF
ncbi:MAG: hypothetical protein ACK4GO_12895 [Gemmobacter sp.]